MARSAAQFCQQYAARFGCLEAMVPVQAGDYWMLAEGEAGTGRAGHC